MEIITTILIILLVISALTSILLILLQDDQGSGMGLFGSSGQSPFTTGDSLLSRLTRIFTISFAVLCLAVAFTITRFGVNQDALEQAKIEAEKSSQDNPDWILDIPVDNNAGSGEANNN